MQDGKHVILCVDDDQDVTDALRIVLESNDYIVVAAASAEDGLKAYKESSPDLMIIDLMMEEVDAGMAMVKDLKILGNTAPIYMLSSVGDSLSETTDCSALGLSGVFQKPIDNHTLLSTMKATLSGRG